MSGEVMKSCLSVLEPSLKKSKIKNIGTIVLGTVKGDMHDIGKNIFKILAVSSGFSVIDLGVDVSSERIEQAVKENNPRIVGFSALLTNTMPEMENIIRNLEVAGLRKNVKIIVGGSPVTREFAAKIGADYRAKDAIDGVNKCNEWVSGGRAI